MPEYYTKIRAFSSNNEEWDFKKYVPDLIVINLGTNDSSYCKGIEDRSLVYAEKYTEFLKTVHELNPGAKILCCLGLMEQKLFAYLEKAASDFVKETGFKDIYTLKLTLQDDKKGFAASWHPVAENHDMAAREVTAKIREILAL